MSEQFQRLAIGFSKEAAVNTRISRLKFPLPLATSLFPQATFDLRRALVVHARGIAEAAIQYPEKSSRDRAYTMSAELFLMQHTCHWFCKSAVVASMRMLARHQTSHELLIASVSPKTRSAYLALIQGR